MILLSSLLCFKMSDITTNLIARSVAHVYVSFVFDIPEVDENILQASARRGLGSTICLQSESLYEVYLIRFKHKLYKHNRKNNMSCFD